MGTETHRTIDSIADAWDELADEIDAPPFLRPGWFAAWHEAFGCAELTIVAVRRGTRLAAVLPLVERHGGARSPTNDHTPLFDILAVDDAAAHDLARAALERRPRSVTLQLVDPDAPATRGWLTGAAAAGYATASALILRSPYIDTTCEWAAYEARIDAKMKSDIRRRRRRMDDEGEVTLEVHDGTTGLDALLDEGFHVEAAGWKGQTGTAIIASPTTRRFYRQVARWAAERGWLRLCFLRLDGHPVAFDYNIHAGRVYYGLKGGYDEAFRRFSPGKVLLMSMIERIFDEGVDRYDFLGEDEPYKLDWSDGTRPRVLAQAFSPSPLGAVERIAYTHGRPLAKRALAGARRFRARRPRQAGASGGPTKARP
jgi:CelD/BcsL family acetyltransferase involved in cellulose biosynthesis